MVRERSCVEDTRPGLTDSVLLKMAKSRKPTPVKNEETPDYHICRLVPSHALLIPKAKPRSHAWLIPPGICVFLLVHWRALSAIYAHGPNIPFMTVLCLLGSVLSTLYFESFLARVLAAFKDDKGSLVFYSINCILLVVTIGWQIVVAVKKWMDTSVNRVVHVMMWGVMWALCNSLIWARVPGPTWHGIYTLLPVSYLLARRDLHLHRNQLCFCLLGLILLLSLGYHPWYTPMSIVEHMRKGLKAFVTMATFLTATGLYSSVLHSAPH